MIDCPEILHLLMQVQNDKCWGFFACGLLRLSPRNAAKLESPTILQIDAQGEIARLNEPTVCVQIASSHVARS